MGDFVDDYVEWTKHKPSPELFRKWAAITALSGMFERRVWCYTSAGPQFSNLYTMLVAPPGVGKSQAINPIEQLIVGTKKYFCSPNNVSPASFVDALSRATRTVILPDNKVLQYHHLFVFAAELGVFMGEHNLGFLSIINELFDNKDNFREEKRHSIKEPIDIAKPMATLLLGSQPGFLGAMLPESAWTMGWTSRLLMVYASTSPSIPLFGAQQSRDDLKKSLVRKIEESSDYYGEMKWTQEAINEMERWRKSGWDPTPDHPKLANYLPRRGPIFMIKLSMASALSRANEMAIRLCDVERAREWLLEIESRMPEIFRDMVLKSDDQVIEETFQFAFNQHLKTRKPVAGSQILRFLCQKTPAEKAEKILSLMEKSGILDRLAGRDDYIPRAREQHGLGH